MQRSCGHLCNKHYQLVVKVYYYLHQMELVTFFTKCGQELRLVKTNLKLNAYHGKYIQTEIRNGETVKMKN